MRMHIKMLMLYNSNKRRQTILFELYMISSYFHFIVFGSILCIPCSLVFCLLSLKLLIVPQGHCFRDTTPKEIRLS